MPRVVLTRWVFTAVMATGVGIGLGMAGGEAWAQPEPPREAEPAAKCKVDLRLTGTMADVVSNVLLRLMRRRSQACWAVFKERKPVSPPWRRTRPRRDSEMALGTSQRRFHVRLRQENTPT
jgi:hypothetical protein